MALLAYLILFELHSWIRTTIPLIKGELGKKSSIVALTESFLLTGLTTFATFCILTLPLGQDLSNQSMRTFLTVMRINLVIAYLTVLFHMMIFNYNVFNLWSISSKPLSERLYTEASEVEQE